MKLPKIFKWKKNPNVKVSVATRVIRTLIIAFIIAYCVSVSILLLVRARAYFNNVENRIITTCSTVANIINYHDIIYYYDSMEEDEGYKFLQKNVSIIVGDDSMVESLYIFVPEEKGFCVIAGRDNIDKVDIPLGDYYEYDEDDYANMVPDIKAGKSGSGYVTHADQMRLCAWAPVHDMQGEIVAYVTIEKNIDDIAIEYLNSEGHPFINTAVIFLIILAALMMILQREVTGPLTRLTSFVTSYGSMDEEIKIPEFKNPDELHYLANSFKEMDERIKKFIKEATDIATKEANMNTELSIARGIQLSMLNTEFPINDAFELYAYMNPAAYIGGDFYDFFFIDDNHLALVIADVSGGNVSGAMFMMRSVTNIKNWTLNIKTDPAQILYNVNNELCTHNDEGMFVTAWLGILDLTTGKMLCANAGHENPLVKHTGGNFEEMSDPHGLAIGGMENMDYTNYEIELQNGDEVFVYTDGCTDAMNEAEELFGIERLVETANKYSDSSSKEMIDSIFGELSRHMGDRPQYDDITMLLLKFTK